MPRNWLRSAVVSRGALVACAVAVLAGALACASQPKGPSSSPEETYRALLGRNTGLSGVRSVVEARVSFAGHSVSLPGVLRLDALGGFRLDLLDPLDRPLAVLYAEGGRIVQYRPAQARAASLGVFPSGCRGIDPADWVAVITASSLGPVAGERVAERSVWGGSRSLERYRGGDLVASVRFREAEGMLQPRTASWYCGDDVVMQVQFRSWVQAPPWMLPTRFDISYPKAGLDVSLELREIEGNPPPTSEPLWPRLGPEVGWSTWKLPE